MGIAVFQAEGRDVAEQVLDAPSEVVGRGADAVRQGLDEHQEMGIAVPEAVAAQDERDKAGGLDLEIVGQVLAEEGPRFGASSSIMIGRELELRLVLQPLP